MQNFTQLILSASQDLTRKCDPSSVKNVLCNAIPGATDLPSLLTKFMVDAGGMIALLAIAAIVYAGLRMVMANGEKGQIDSAKKILTYAIYGLIISVFAYTAVVAIENFIGVKTLPATDSISTTPVNPLGYSNLTDFITAMIKNVLVVIGVVTLLMVIVNGFRYLISRGDKAQIDSAKKGLTWSIAGLMLSLLAFTIINAIAKLIS